MKTRQKLPIAKLIKQKKHYKAQNKTFYDTETLESQTKQC